jgi:hypothetical protein
MVLDMIAVLESQDASTPRQDAAQAWADLRAGEADR